MPRASIGARGFLPFCQKYPLKCPVSTGGLVRPINPRYPCKDGGYMLIYTYVDIHAEIR